MTDINKNTEEIKNKYISKRLSNSTDYERPDKTITELLQNKKDIEEQLKDFEEIPDDNLFFTCLKTYLKYISFNKKTKKEQFRFGGLLIKVDNEYVVLEGKGGLRFSVQRTTKDDKGKILHTTRFFKKTNPNDHLDILLAKYNDDMTEKDKVIRKQQKEIIAMKKKLK